MINPFKEVNWNPGTVEKRAFAKSLMIGFPIMALLVLVAGRLLRHEWPVQTALLIGGIGAGLGMIFFLLPALARPFYIFWYGFACCMGLVVGNVVLSLVYFILVTLTGFFLKLSGHRGLRRRPDPAAATYWQDAPPTPAAAKYFQQF